MGIPETGKAEKAIDGALERITYYRDELTLAQDELTAECARQSHLEWSIIYVTTVADLMVNAPLADRIQFASEIRAVALELDLLPEPARVVARPDTVEQPPAEGDWQLDTNIHVGED